MEPGAIDDGGIDQRALFHHDASFKKPLVDGVTGVVPLLHAQHGVEWTGATTVARFGADRFDETEHAGHGSRAFMRAKHISLRILRRLPLNSLSAKVIHIEPYPLMLIGTDDFTSGTCSILL